MAKLIPKHETLSTEGGNLLIKVAIGNKMAGDILIYTNTATIGRNLSEVQTILNSPYQNDTKVNIDATVVDISPATEAIVTVTVFEKGKQIFHEEYITPSQNKEIIMFEILLTLKLHTVEKHNNDINIQFSGLLLFFLLLSVSLLGQEIKYDNIRGNGQPGMMIIDASPQQVNTPETPGAFAATIPSLFNNQGGLSGNFAVEFSTFWMRNHPDFTISRYYKPKVFMDKYYNLSSRTAFSIATRSATYDTNARQLGIGMRMQLNRGKISENQICISARNYAIDLNNAKRLLNSIPIFSIKDLKKEEGDTAIIQAISKNKEALSQDKLNEYIEYIKLAMELTKYSDEFITYRDSLKISMAKIAEKKLNKEITASHPIGHIWELNAAYGTLLPTNELKYIRSQRAAIWLTYTYRSPNMKWEFSGMTRIIADSLDHSPLVYADLGGKIKITPFPDSPNLTFNGEGLVRYQSNVKNKPFDSRFMFTASYAVTKDFSYTVNLGKEFNNVYSLNGNFLAAFGINYTIGGKNQ